MGHDAFKAVRWRDRIHFSPEEIKWFKSRTYSDRQLDELRDQLVNAGASNEAAVCALYEGLGQAVGVYKIERKGEREDPKPTELRRNLRKIEEEAATLCELLGGLSSSEALMIDQCDGPGDRLTDAQEILVKLRNAAQGALRRASRKTGVGRPLEVARRGFVKELARIWLYATGSRPGISNPGPFWRFAMDACEPLFETHVTDDLIKNAARAVRDEVENPE